MKIILFIISITVSLTLCGCSKPQGRSAMSTSSSASMQKAVPKGEAASQPAVSAMHTPQSTYTPTPTLLPTVNPISQMNFSEPFENIYNTLTVERKKDLNIFLSNFSEAYFYNYDSNNQNFDEMISFAYIHNLINSNSFIKYSDSDMGISVQRCNETLNKYLGVTVPNKSTYRWVCDGNNYWTPAASGESYNFFQQQSICMIKMMAHIEWVLKLTTLIWKKLVRNIINIQILKH